MKRILPFLFVLICLGAQARQKPSLETRCVRICSAWDNLWAVSDYSKKLSLDERTGEIIYREGSFKRYLKNRTYFLRRFRKVEGDFRKTERPDEYAYFENKLRQAISDGDEDCLLSAANLYLQVLPPDSIRIRLRIYTRILLPRYYNRRDLSEIYYIYKVLESLKRKFPRDSTLIGQSCDYVMDKYRQLKAEMPMRDYLKGMWVSAETEKKHLPRFIMTVVEKDSVYYGILNRSSGYLQKNKIGYSVAAPFMVDSAYKITLQYKHAERREGLSEAGVQAVNTMIGGVGQSAVKAIYSSNNLSSVAKTGLDAGLHLLTNLFMSSVGSASRVSETNRFIYLHLQPAADRNVLTGDYLFQSEKWYSDPSLPSDKYSDNGWLRLYKLCPDDEILFAADKSSPIICPCRSIYFHKEFYSVYKTFWKHRSLNRSFRSNPICYYPLFIVGIPAFASTGDNGYNKKMLKKLQLKYDLNQKKR